ncbi:MAG: hypothetical protein U0703_07550 [Anaerolineae bacterium]
MRLVRRDLPADQLINLCPACGKPLLARYDLLAARAGFDRDQLASRPPNLWRYAEVLPVRSPDFASRSARASRRCCRWRDWALRSDWVMSMRRTRG